jgi:ribosomal protein L11 methyltransferase
MDYFEITCKFPYNRERAEFLIGLLASIGFDGFIENEEGIQAYIPADKFNTDQLARLEYPGMESSPVIFEKHLIAEQNWNQTWESSYEPVLIGGICLVRAPFHPPAREAVYDLVIEPKMSFGTAHHETTAMMIELLLQSEVKNKTVLDMGCGTGVLAILASMKGAGKVFAVDNDRWAYENSIENVRKNNVTNCSVLFGDASILGNERFDVILANINRNILVAGIPNYTDMLNPGGTLTVSGFTVTDEALILETATNNGLVSVRKMNKGEWAAIMFRNMNPTN